MSDDWTLHTDFGWTTEKDGWIADTQAEVLKNTAALAAFLAERQPNPTVQAP